MKGVYKPRLKRGGLFIFILLKRSKIIGRFIKEHIMLPYTMKKKLSITIEEDKIRAIEDIIKNDSFRNKSHFIEMAVNKYLQEVHNE